MNNKKINIVSLFCLFIVFQPIFDVFVYWVKEIKQVDLCIISIIRPLIAILFYFVLLFSKKINKSLKIYSFIYLSITGIYFILHLLNVKDNFFDLSYGNIQNEARQLINYGYYILQLINVFLIFKISDKNEKKRIIMSIVCACGIMSILYLTSVITKTSLLTYGNHSIKQGFKGWSISSHYIGHSLLLMFPIVIFSIYNNYLKNNLAKIILLVCITASVYLIGTKSSLFGVDAILIFTSILILIKLLIKKEKLNFNNCLILLFSIFVICTFKMTYGYNNFYNQSKLYNRDVTEKSINIDDYIKEESINRITNDDYEKDANQNEFSKHLSRALKKYKTPNFSTFDNRTIQIKINNEILKQSPLPDKLLGYGYYTMINCTWVETDTFGIFFCFGLIGFLLIILVPLLYFVLSGIKALINYKTLNLNKFLFGFSMCLSIGLITFVGYTLHFSQTVFYFITLLVISDYIFKDEDNSVKKRKKYLFAINDLSMGGAEVGLVDVVNELSKTESVDLVLLRKQGPLVEKVNKNVNIYEILNKDYSKFKRKIYHLLYFMGGTFTKYVYKKTIKSEYDVEVAYIEGYPAIFIANSTNDESVKIASIRVGLKNHKLKAEKIPFGLCHLKNAYKKMDKIYTVSNETTKEFIEKFPSCKYKTSTIYTYFNVDDMKNKANEKMEFKFDDKYTNFLAVGRFNEQKAYLRLVEAFEEVYKENKKARLHILGKNDTEYGQKVITLIKEKNLEDKIILHGVIKNPYPYIKHCDCLVSSSLYEGYPRVINEALALKKLCIGTNVTGTKEALHNGKMGLLVEDSKDGLVNGMLEVINNKNIIDNYKEEINKFDGNKQSFFESFKNLCTRKEKMIIYMPKLSIGGMEKALVNLINYAKLNDKYDLTLYLIYKGNSNYLEYLPTNINLVVAWKYNWNILGKLIAGIKLLFRLVFQVFIEYDISISYSYQHPILLSLTRTASKNSIVYIHSNITQAVEKNELKKIIKKRKYEKFNKIICVSNDAKKALENVIPKKTNIFVVNNPIDGENILKKSQEPINDFVFKKDKIYFINVCRHTEIYKRLTRIINATEKLNKEGYKFEVLFIGDGEDSRLYSSLINDKKIKNIHMLGKKTNPYPYMTKSNAFLLSSAREGYPVVFLESMVLNIPIVTTNVSDAKLDIENKYGIVVNNDDDSIYLGMKEYLDKGFIINKKFDYKNFNTKIIKSTYRIYEKD